MEKIQTDSDDLESSDEFRDYTLQLESEELINRKEKAEKISIYEF